MAEGLINLTDLLEPISADSPGGADPRAELSANSPYRSLKDARNRLRTLERRLDEGFESDPPDWVPVLESAVEILKSSAKDFEVACWATEALVRLDGFNGLAQGFGLIEGIVSTFWEHAHPQPEDGDQTYRVTAISNLNGADSSTGTLIWPIDRVPIVVGREVKYARWQYRQASLLEGKDGETKQRLIAEGSASVEKIQLAANEMSPDEARRVMAGVADAVAAFAKMNAALTEKMGADSPPSSNIDAALAECQQIAKSFLAAKAAVSGTAPAGAGQTGPGGVTPAVGTIVGGGGGGGFSIGLPAVSPGVNREQILEVILQAAAALRQVEPQSVIPPLLERTVKWARLPVEQLLRELITDDSTLSSVTRLTGVKYFTPEESS